MIALWMAYGLVTGPLLALPAWLLERVARGRRWPTRGIWATAMGAMLLIGVGVTGTQIHGARRAALSGASPEGGVVARDGQRSVSERAGRARHVLALGELGLRARAALEARLAVESVRLAPWNRALLGGWALLTAFLAGAVAQAAVEGRRLRQGLERRRVGGTSVLLSDAMGPSALGGHEPAVVLPRWALDLDAPLLGMVLCHEREHLDARDPLLLLVALSAVVLVPWHLPLWWCWRRLRLAVEVDCDARVLRAHPDVRRYAELLLLTAERVARTPWVSRPLITVAAPLRPHLSHLASRIDAMTQPRRSLSVSRATLLVGSACVTAIVACAVPAPRRPASPAAATKSEPARGNRALVHITSVGLEGAEPASGRLPVHLVVFADGPARVGIGTAEPMLVADTLHLSSLPAITADVTESDVHLRLVSGGRMSVGGDVTGGPATHLTATGRHIVLLKGGVGVEIRDTR